MGGGPVTTWTVNGKTFTFAMPYNIERIEGLGGVEADLLLQRGPYQDGSTVMEKTQKERLIILYGEIFADSREQLHERRAVMLRMFNPLNEAGTLNYCGKAIEAEADGGPTFSNSRSGISSRMIINLLAPDPNFYDPDEVLATVRGFSGGWRLPWSFPRSFGNVGSFVNLVNEGDVPTPVEITVTGYVRYPALTNEATGERIMVDIEIPAGRKLVIVTEYGRKRVEIMDLDGDNRENIFGRVVRDDRYSLWHLQPGENLITYASAEELGGEASIKYYHKYSGI